MTSSQADTVKMPHRCNNTRATYSIKARLEALKKGLDETYVLREELEAVNSAL